MTDEKDIKLTIEAGEQTEPAVNEVSENQELADESPSLKEVIREQAIEDEAPQSKTFTLRKILGGDILTTQTVRRQVWLLLLITLFVIIYISNRYSCQQDLIMIDKLQKTRNTRRCRAVAN